MKNEELEMTKLPIKHPNQKKLDDALEKMGKNIKKKNKKKEITIPSSHRKVQKD